MKSAQTASVICLHYLFFASRIPKVGSDFGFSFESAKNKVQLFIPILKFLKNLRQLKSYFELTNSLRKYISYYSSTFNSLRFCKTFHKAVTYDVSFAYGHHKNILMKSLKIVYEDISWRNS